METSPAALVPVLLAVLTLTAGCRSSRTYEPRPGPYDRIPTAYRESLREARDALEGGDARRALALLGPMADERPILLPVRVFLQDVELSLLESGEGVGGLEVPEPGVAESWLGDLYHQRADANPSAEGYVLAARLATRAGEALPLLEQAAALDPGCVWALYGRAWWRVADRRFREARRDVRGAFRLDPGHLPTMRLWATMLANAGETADAIACLRQWLDRSEGEAWIDPRQRAEARVDLAALLILDEEPQAALLVLDSIAPAGLEDPSRFELVKAVALEDTGERTLALTAARRAKQLDPESLLALVQQAWILELEGRPAQEARTWEQILDEALESRERRTGEPAPDPEGPVTFDVQALLIQLMAHARLERLGHPRGTAELP